MSLRNYRYSAALHTLERGDVRFYALGNTPRLSD